MKRRVTVAIKNQGREVSKGQLTLVTELVDAEKLTRDEAEVIRRNAATSSGRFKLRIRCAVRSMGFCTKKYSPCFSFCRAELIFAIAARA